MAFDAGIDYKARQNERKKQMEGVTDPAELARLQAENDADEVARTEKLASNLSKYGKWASDSELDSAAGLMAERQIGTGFETQKQNLNQGYDQAKQNASNDALSRGMARSSFVSDRMAGLDSKRENALSDIDASKALAIQNAKDRIIDNYQTNQANKLAAEKSEFAQYVGAYHGQYGEEADRILNDEDPSNDWKAPILRAAESEYAQNLAKVNAQYGDFSGLDMSDTARSNAGGIFANQYPYLFAPTYGYGGGGYRVTGGGGDTDDGDQPKKPPFSGGNQTQARAPGAYSGAYSARGAQLLGQVQAMQKRGVPSGTIVSEVKRATQTRAITQTDANRILTAIGL